MISLINLSTNTTLNKIRDGLNITHKKLNNMYDYSYLYTLNGYRAKFIDSASKFNIDETITNTYLLNLIKTEYYPYIKNRCDEIASIPLIEQKTPDWFLQRERMISASDSGYFLKKCGVSKAVDSLKIKVGLKKYCNSNAPPLMHGNTYEDVSRAIYESRNGVSVTEYGILNSPTECIGASPDGIVTACHNDTIECQSKYGRLLEIKNPYSREIDNTIKEEYMVQILQQQYTTQIPVCDFVETTIVDAYCNTNNSNYKPYMNLAEMLEDKLDITKPQCLARIKNKNIPADNLNKFGNEKGLLVWYKKIVSEGDVRNKYIMYPLTLAYETQAIEKWIVDTNSALWTQGYTYVCTKFWRLDVYSEKTVVYDQQTFEGDYVPKLCEIWEVIVKCNAMRVKGQDVAAFIESLEADKDSPFYNEKKRKKKVNSEGETGNSSNSSNSNSGDVYASHFKPNKDIIINF
jgi:hypothetical protein